MSLWLFLAPSRQLLLSASKTKQVLAVEPQSTANKSNKEEV